MICFSVLNTSFRVAWAGHWLLSQPKQQGALKEELWTEKQQQILPRQGNDCISDVLHIGTGSLELQIYSA